MDIEEEKQEIIETMKKMLLLYEDSINQFIDNAIQIVTDDSNNYNKLIKK